MSYLYKLLPELNSKDESYQSALIGRYDDYIKYSEVPPAFIDAGINVNKLPKNIKILYENISDIVTDRLNFGFNMPDYSYTGMLSCLLINEYFKHCISNDILAENIIYIDTNLLLDDYKKLMDNGENQVSPTITHSIDTLYKNIESAPFIIWDKFTMLNSNYDKQKLYNILSIRYRKGLGNIYFLKGGYESLGRIFDIETSYVMNIASIIDCSNEHLEFRNDDKKGNWKW